MLATIPQNQVHQSPHRVTGKQTTKQPAIQPVKPNQPSPLTIKHEMIQQRKQTEAQIAEVARRQNQEPKSTPLMQTGQVEKPQGPKCARQQVSNLQAKTYPSQTGPSEPQANTQQTILKQTTSKKNHDYPPLSVTIKQELVSQGQSRLTPAVSIGNTQPRITPNVPTGHGRPSVPDRQRTLPQAQTVPAVTVGQGAMSDNQPYATPSMPTQEVTVLHNLPSSVTPQTGSEHTTSSQSQPSMTPQVPRDLLTEEQTHSVQSDDEIEVLDYTPPRSVQSGLHKNLKEPARNCAANSPGN